MILPKNKFKRMNLISLYTARATAHGGRSGGRVSTDDGALDFHLELPPELGGDVIAGQTKFNPEQLIACAWASSIADSIGFAAKQHNRILREITVKVKIILGQFENDGFGISAEFQIDLPELSVKEAEKIINQARNACPYTKAFGQTEMCKMSVASKN